MDSLEKLVRASLATWAGGLSWQVAPTVQVEDPEPGTKPALPTLAVHFDREDVDNPSPREILPGVFHLGQAEARVAFVFRAGSLDDAEAYRADWRNVAWTAAMDASTTGLAPVVPLTIRVGDEAYTAKLYLTAETELASFEDTQLRGLWLMRGWTRLVYPALALRSASSLLDITLELGGETFAVGDFRAPVVLSSAPAAAGAIGLDEPVELVFDLEMDADSVEAAVDADLYTVTADADGVTFAFLPVDGFWAAGSNTLTLTGARSARGARLASYSLTFTAS